jgi:hypothetical protein
MKSIVTNLLYAALGCLALLFCAASVPAQAQTVNILLIHGRTDPNSSNPPERYGVWAIDQMGVWGGNKVLTSGNVYYVQWDAWNEHFDSNTPSPAGGWYWVNYAVNRFCNAENNQLCYVICHSAGCAAFENYLAKSDYATNSILIPYVIAAESAAGGSELADSDVALLGEALGQNTVAPIDASLTTSFARGEYNHNNMQGVLIRGTGGTSNDVATEVITTCAYFPEQYTSNPNPNCTRCPLTGAVSCDDGAVALHSTCGHSRAAPFLDCNSTLPGWSDHAGTYDYHGWWIGDSGWSGPYSPMGTSDWNGGFHTYRIDHSAGKKLAIDEYSDAPASLAP